MESTSSASLSQYEMRQAGAFDHLLVLGRRGLREVSKEGDGNPG